MATENLAAIPRRMFLKRAFFFPMTLATAAGASIVLPSIVLPKLASACGIPQPPPWPDPLNWQETDVTKNWYNAINPTLQYILDHGGLDSYSTGVLAGQETSLATEHANLGNIFSCDQWFISQQIPQNWMWPDYHLADQYGTDGINFWQANGTWQLFAQASAAMQAVSDGSYQTRPDWCQRVLLLAATYTTVGAALGLFGGPLGALVGPHILLLSAVMTLYARYKGC